MNLLRFLDLLHNCEDSTLAMLEAVETIDIPSTWEHVDVVKQTISLMVGTIPT